MLTISPAASDAICQLVDAAELPTDSAGIRIAQGPETPEGTAVELALVDGPDDDDQVVINEGASVFVDDQIALLLEDKTLDAQISEGQVAFALVGEEETGLEEGPSRNGNSPD